MQSPVNPDFSAVNAVRALLVWGTCVVCALVSIGASAAGTIAFEAVVHSETQGAFNLVPLQAQHNVAPVVIPVAEDRGSNSCTTRIKNVTSTNFEMKCVEPESWDGGHIDMENHYIAVEPGVHSIDLVGGGTTTIVAACVSTTEVQHNCGAGCGTAGWEAVSFGHVFSTPPIVLHSINTMNSESGTPPTTVSEPFLTSVIETGSITTTGFNIALERSENATGTVVAESVCFVAMEPVGCATLDFGGGETVDYMAANTAVNIDGWDDGCDVGEGADFGTCFSDPPVVVASKITNNGADGGWPRQCGAVTATAARFTIDEDTAVDAERNHSPEQLSFMAFAGDFATTPVTLSWIKFDQADDGLVVAWETATETGNIGFHVEAEIGGVWQRLNSELIKSKVINSTTTTSYSSRFDGVFATRMRLVDVDLRGRRETHGPFAVGVSSGSRQVASRIDWAPQLPADPAADATTPTAAQQYAPASAGDDTVSSVELLVDKTGIYRIGFDELVSAGYRFNDVPVKRLAVRQGQTAVRRRIISQDRIFGPGDYVEFIGESVPASLYTRTNVYVLEDRPALVALMPSVLRKAGDGPAARSYRATVIVNDDNEYGFSSPTGDPWFSTGMLVTGTAQAWDFELTLDAMDTQSDMQPRVSVGLWGGTDFPDFTDHHVRLRMNGNLLADEMFDGIEPHIVREELAPNVIADGVNTLNVELQTQPQVPFSLVNMDRYGVSYPRLFRARDDALDFRHKAEVFEIDGFDSERVVAYRLPEGDMSSPRRIRNLDTLRKDDGTTTVRIAGGDKRGDRYLLAGSDSLLRPKVRGQVDPAPAFSSDLELLIVAHDNFYNHLDNFVAVRQQQGLSVAVVTPSRIYRRFSDGVTDPDAIRRYVRRLHKRNGLESVLLVGADTYDYFDNTGAGSVSYVPSIYAKTDDVVAYTPADALFGDVDGDGLGDIAVGRWPVRNLDELERVIDKTLRYGQRSDDSTALLVAGTGDEGRFASILDEIADGMESAFSIERAYSTLLGTQTARESVINTLNAGPALTGFFGHSSTTHWTFDGLFSSSDALALTNTEPTVITQWGCWNTYHVSPEFNTLGHAFLAATDSGAAAVLGAATLTSARNEKAIGEAFMTEIVQPGMTLGKAMMKAKRKVASKYPQALDVLLGWSLLGDPTLVIKR